MKYYVSINEKYNLNNYRKTLAASKKIVEENAMGYVYSISEDTHEVKRVIKYTTGKGWEKVPVSEVDPDKFLM